MKARTLKIEATGDFWRGEIKPRIRLHGYWLERAGFKPGDRVEIELAETGTMILRCISPAVTSPEGGESTPSAPEPLPKRHRVYF